VAGAGRDDGYLGEAGYRDGSLPEADDPVAGVLREGRMMVLPVLADVPGGRWRAEAVARGYTSIAAFPLDIGSEVIGCLVLYAESADVFAADELKLLAGLLNDLSVGIRAVRNQMGREQAQSELRRTNEELERRYEDLRKMDVIKDGLLRDVSHELKTPVAKQAMQLELLRTRLGAECVGRVEEIVAIMERSVRRQEQVIRNLLDLSRLEAGGYRCRIGPVRLREALDRTIEDYRPTIHQAGMNLHVSAEDLVVAADEAMLWHVLSNLINNLIKFRRTDGPGTAWITARRDGDRALVMVRDDGIGVAPEHLSRLFQRFYQGSATSEGSGVGLTICQRMVTEMQGTITFESGGVGKGSLVTVGLPLCRPAAA
jgi:signal transduction histidine kinase